MHAGRKILTAEFLRAPLITLVVGATFLGLAGCISSERQLATDKDQCAAQGLAPSTSAFEDCVSVANGRRRDAEARQSARMQQMQDQSMENFMHSQSAAP
jgi:hypothetical protein